MSYGSANGQSEVIPIQRGSITISRLHMTTAEPFRESGGDFLHVPRATKQAQVVATSLTGSEKLQHVAVENRGVREPWGDSNRRATRVPNRQNTQLTTTPVVVPPSVLPVPTPERNVTSQRIPFASQFGKLFAV